MPSEEGVSGGTIAALVAVAILAIWLGRPGAKPGGVAQPRQVNGMSGPMVRPPGQAAGFTSCKLEPPYCRTKMDGGLAERRDAHAAINRLYSSADVDPIVSGHLYEHNEFLRPVYAQRTSHGDEWGLTEYSSSGGPGDVGVDVGPYGLAEYGSRQIGYDDGIPPEWAFPSTPVRWYAPKQRDHFGPQGPTAYSEGLYPLTEGDHEPYVS